jgi:hypothetical protein
LDQHFICGLEHSSTATALYRGRHWTSPSDPVRRLEGQFLKCPDLLDV